MANYFSAARTRELLGLTSAHRAPTGSPHLQHPFTDADHLREMRLREAVDALALSARWAVIVLLQGDPKPRRFFLRGTYEQVKRRASNFFPDNPCVIAIEPSGLQVGGELIDSRLNHLIGR